MNETTIDNPNPLPEVDAAHSLLESPRRNAAKRGWGWFVGGFRLFKAAPLIWMLAMLISIAITTPLDLIPLITPQLPTWLEALLALPSLLLVVFFNAGLLVGCRDLERGQALSVQHLFRGFSQRHGRPRALGVFVLLHAPFMFAFAFAMASGGELTARILTMSLLVALVMMLFAFTPPLLMLHRPVSLVYAMKMSLVGTLKNILPLLVCLLIGVLLPSIVLGLGLAAVLFLLLVLVPMIADLTYGETTWMILISTPTIITVVLGLLVLIPVSLGALYSSYKDIFLE